MGPGWLVKAELEWPDVPNGPHSLLPGWRWSDVCWWIVNSNGAANDPQRRAVRNGGMVLTPEFGSPQKLADQAGALMEVLKPAVNYRCSMRASVYVPGLAANVGRLQQLAEYTRRHLPPMWNAVDPLRPLASGLDKSKGAQEFYLAALRKRHYLVSERCHALRMTATDVARFAAAEAPPGLDGSPVKAPLVREALDLRAADTGWVTLRCFAHPRTAMELHAAAGFAVDWVHAALAGASSPQQPVMKWISHLPRQLPYDAQLEKSWKYTNFHDNSRRTVLARLAAMGLA